MKQLSEINHWQESINQVMHCDCLELMRMMPDKCVDLCLTDPPYGIGESGSKNHSRGCKASTTKFKELNWDNETPRKEIFDEIMRISKNQIIWGGNYFVEYLNNSSCWIVWDKDNGDTDFADCELAWTNQKTAVRKFKWKWQGMLQEDMKNKDVRKHPTQKPLELGRWCIENYAKEAKLIFDPFGGSGTFARAAKDAGIDFITCDKEVDYCEIMEERLKQETLF
jgi:site-specific DNA-methyltransferase (adenine-specific)